MTLAVSTSSPTVSVALTDDGGQVLAYGLEAAPWAAGGALGSLLCACLERSGAAIEDVTRVIADEGPGGFTGVRVGVTFAKCLSWSLGVPLSLVPAFDLIDPHGPAFVPMKRGEWRYRIPGRAAELVIGEDAPSGRGYGRNVESQTFPDARLAAVVGSARDADPLTALPAYLAEPSISLPKDARVLRGAPPCP